MRAFNIGSNIGYFIIGLTGNWITAITGLILTLGSGWMHYDMNRESIKADWFGMYAFSFACIAYAVGPAAYIPAILLIVVAGLLIERLWHNNMIGLVVLTGIMVKIGLDPANGYISAACFGVAYAVRQAGHGTKYNEITHGFWHLLTQAGYYFLIR